MFGWLKTILLALGVISKGEDIVKSEQDSAKEKRQEQQGEQNANAKSTADVVKSVEVADRAEHSDTVRQRVQSVYERP